MKPAMSDRALAPLRLSRALGLPTQRPVPALLGALLATTALALALPAAAQNAAVVNGVSIPSERVDSFVKAMVAQGRPDTPELREAVREELIARELFVQEAEKRKLSANPDIESQLIRARQDILIGALIRDQLTASPVTDEQVKAEYERLTKDASGGKEYKSRHILVESEEEAKALVAELDKGAKFEELAAKSKDPGSAARGGDLDWNTPDTFVPEFSNAMVGLEKGKYTTSPVRTQFGWHVIRLDDVRDAAPPPLESVAPQLKQQLERNRVVELQQSLRDAATIK